MPQWAAVNTCRSLIRVPPQFGLLVSGITRSTCHGIEYGSASIPSTTRGGSIFIPHCGVSVFQIVRNAISLNVNPLLQPQNSVCYGIWPIFIPQHNSCFSFRKQEKYCCWILPGLRANVLRVNTTFSPLHAYSRRFAYKNYYNYLWHCRQLKVST